MISVVCLRYHPATGGVETTVLETTTRLAKSFELRVVTSDLKVERPFQRLSEDEQLDQYQGVPIAHLPSKKFLPVEGYGVIMKGLNEALEGSDMLHLHAYGSHHADKAVKYAARQGIPSILTAYLHPATHSHHKILRTLYDSTIGKRTLKRCTGIITLTSMEKDYIARRFGVPKERITVIPSGTDIDKFRDFGYEREENSLLFVGRLSPVKRLDMLFRALVRVKKRVPKVKLRIIGRDWGVEAQLLELAEQLKIGDNLEFLGEVTFDELVERYNRAKAFVLTSRFETFGVTIMEAIACGAPVVVTGVGGIPEVVGNAGIICEENDESVSKGIIRILTDDENYDELKENTRKRKGLFHWNDITEKVKSLYERTLENSGRKG